MFRGGGQTVKNGLGNQDQQWKIVQASFAENFWSTYMMHIMLEKYKMTLFIRKSRNIT